MFDKRTEVKAIMTRDVKTVEPRESMDKVAELLEDEAVHHVPVVEEGKVVGIISSTDLNKVMHHFTLFKVSNASSVNKSVLRSLLAREVMTKPVATIHEEATLLSAAAIFRENLFHALPVVNAKAEIVGIITPYDLVNYAYAPEEFMLEKA